MFKNYLNNYFLRCLFIKLIIKKVSTHNYFKQIHNVNKNYKILNRQIKYEYEGKVECIIFKEPETACFICHYFLFIRFFT